MRTILCLILCTSFAAALQGQQAAYFVLGEKELQGLHVYDVIQDAQEDYFISTNEGIYRYDYHHFEKLACTQAKGSAVFNFVRNSQGVIFCCNINHQIFRILNGQCELIYELRPDEINPDLSLSISPDDGLIGSARKIIVFDAQFRPRARFSHHNRYWGLPFQTLSGQIVYHLPGTDSLLAVSGSGFEWRRLLRSANSPAHPGMLSFFRIAHTCYAVDLDTKHLYAFDEQQLSLKSLPPVPAFSRSRSLRLYPGTDHTWIAGTLPGIFRLTRPLPDFQPELWYEDFLISDVFQDHEGNVLLSTFDNGILVIPNLNIPDAIHHFRDDPVTALYPDPETGILYLGSTKGRLLSYQEGQLRILGSSGMRPINAIHGRPGFPYLLFDDGQIRALHKSTGKTTPLSLAALKDAFITEDQTAYLGTNLGLSKCRWDAKGVPTCERLPQFNFRIHLLAQLAEAGDFIASTAQGLFRIHPQGGGQKLQWGGKDIFPTAMLALGDTLILATQNDGLLLGTGQHALKQIWTPKTVQEHFSKLVSDGQTLLTKTSHTLYQFSRKGAFLKNISKVHGFPQARVFDFALQDSLVWVSHTQGVQAANLFYQDKSPQQAPRLRLAQLLVNDQWMAPSPSTAFESHQRKFEFRLTSPTLRHKETTTIRYRLQGYDPDWHTHPNTGAPIVYNALAPGSYTLIAQALNQGQQSSPLTYHFQITPPFYAQWWFILGAALTLLALVLAVFRLLLNRQRKKARLLYELNASKLMAIQSQMNPHFIFNALNSIQDLVLKGDVQNSYSYLNVFANLVRSTLNHSDKNFIDFDQELQLLQLYLSLEQLRFKKEFHYTLQAQGIEDIQVPPLLVQPFVENALLHGLLHKEGPKRLHIKFELQDQLICIIEDNGIGRQQAQAIKERQQSAHESFSGKAIRTRFDILSDLFQGQFGYQYEDLEENGHVTGTRVTLHIPIKRTF